jgi:hypothetical protein
VIDRPEPEQRAISPELLRDMAAAVGVVHTADRAATLAPQAEQHFAQLSRLHVTVNPSTEPAADFRLDQWTGQVSA